jgi:serine/threonine-protein kinase
MSVKESRVNKAYWKTDRFVGLMVILTFLLASGFDLMSGLEWKAYDLGVRFSSTDPANSDVVVVQIDDESLNRIGPWPWPRDLLAHATRILNAAQPAVIGYALPLDAKQSNAGLESVRSVQEAISKNPKLASKKIRRMLRNTELRMDTDQIFANSLRQSGRVVLAMPYIIDPRQLPDIDTTLPAYLTKYKLRNVTGNDNGSGLLGFFRSNKVPVADVVYPPIETLAQHAGGAGLLNLGYGGERYARTEPLVIRYGESYLPSFALMMAARNMYLSTSSIKVDLDEGVTLGSHQTIPSDNSLRVYPHFYRSKKNQPAFKTVSIQDVIYKRFDKKTFKDKTVLIGLTARKHVNYLHTPIGEIMSPVMVTAHTVSSLLNEELYIVPGWGNLTQVLVYLFIAVYLMYLLPRLHQGTAIAITALISIGLINAHFYLMLSESSWVQLMGPLVALVTGHLIMGGKHFIGNKIRHVHEELSEANMALGNAQQSTGNLDMAFEKYRLVTVNETLLNQMYNLGLDYERKRQFNKAVTVFRYIADKDNSIHDVKERLNRNQEVSDALVLGSKKVNSSGDGTLVINTGGVQKPRLGRYQIDRELGRGAMGLVYLGDDPKIGRTVAIKTMSLGDEFEGDKLEDVKKRFFREAETAGRLNHPNIVTIYDVGEDQDLSYIAMDYLKGSDLMAWCKPDNLLPPLDVIDLMIQAADALDYAHEQRVVHRDIKPANMIYDDETKQVTLTDFGVACLVDTSKTKTGTILGSPSYMSPEQLAGAKVDGRSDLFGLGVTFYQLLCGELPFIADSLASLMYKIANEKHPDIRMFQPELHACVSQLINKALQKKAEDRFQTGGQMSKALMRCRDRLIGKKKNKSTANTGRSA